MMRQYDMQEYRWPGLDPFFIQTAQVERDFPLHTHSFVELVIVLGGQGVHVVDAAEYGLKTGDVFVISGHVAHGFRTCQDLQLCNIMFNDRILASTSRELKRLAGFQSLFVLEPFFRRQHEFRSRLTLDAAALVHVRRMIQLLQDEYDHYPEDQGNMLKIHFLSLVAFLSRCHMGSIAPKARDLLCLAESVAAIENNFAQPLRIADLARRGASIRAAFFPHLQPELPGHAGRIHPAPAPGASLPAAGRLGPVADPDCRGLRLLRP